MKRRPYPRIGQQAPQVGVNLCQRGQRRLLRFHTHAEDEYVVGIVRLADADDDAACFVVGPGRCALWRSVGYLSWSPQQRVTVTAAIGSPATATCTAFSWVLASE